MSTTNAHPYHHTASLPATAIEWLRSGGAGTILSLAAPTAATADANEIEPLAAEHTVLQQVQHTPRIGLLNRDKRSAACASCGQHAMFCACAPRDTRLSEDLDPRSPRSAMSAAADTTTSRSRSLRSLLAENAAANLRTFELSAQEQTKRIELDRKSAAAAAKAPERRRRVSFAHEHPQIEAQEVADMMSNARRRRQSMPTMAHASQQVTKSEMAEIVENYFEEEEEEEETDEIDNTETAGAAETTAHPADKNSGLTTSLPVDKHPRMVKSMSLVFEDAEPSQLSSTPPTC
jgi:hypothetical protein